MKAKTYLKQNCEAEEVSKTDFDHQMFYPEVKYENVFKFCRTLCIALIHIEYNGVFDNIIRPEVYFIYIFIVPYLKS
jgi:hypothetical protein